MDQLDDGLICFSFSYTGYHDYCIEEGFIAECPTGEILMMQEAIYGRMELGTCLTLDIGFMNCERQVYIVILQTETLIILAA